MATASILLAVSVDRDMAAQQSNQAEPFEQLVDEFISRHRDGERPSAEEYARQHPHLATEVRRYFPIIALVERAGQKMRSG